MPPQGLANTDNDTGTQTDPQWTEQLRDIDTQVASIFKATQRALDSPAGDGDSTAVSEAISSVCHTSLALVELYRQLNQAAKTQSTQSDVFERSRVLSQLRNKKKQVNPLYQRFLLSGYRLMSHDDGIGGDEQSWAQLEQAVGSVLDAHEPHDAILFAATAEDIHSRIGLMSPDATTDREQASFEDRCLQAASSGAIVSTTAALTELAQEIAPIHASVIELLDGLQALPEDVKKSHGAFTLEIAIVMKRVEDNL